ncbi:MAG: hypothetical protein CMI03_10590 [Oceanospirillaceae bacterium]|nr:hypothetical protein [Oceanospirillaceae bacterium]MBS53180.1 hypothetical protein [Oceanospirillaceae bacterium]
MLMMPGNPEQWILIRGLIRSRFHWGEFPGQLEHALQRHQPAIELLTPELAGNGERWQELTPRGIRAMMEDIRQQVLPATQGKPVTIGAISMGAMIASEWARVYPQEVKALHLINTSFSNLSLPWQRMRLPAFASLVANLASGRGLEKPILYWTSNRKDSSQLAPVWQQYSDTHPLSLRNMLIQILSASGYRGPLQPPVTPAWCYVSMQDRLVSPRCTEKIAQRWQVPIERHNSTGHDLPLDDPEWLINAIVKNWLASS